LYKTEYLIIGLGLGTLIPLLVFVLFWWSTAALVIYKLVQLPESFIIYAAFTGLAIGITINILYLKKLIPGFYTLKNNILIPLYLLCSFIALAFFMGTPIGNIILGILAGLYTGRRHYYLEQHPDIFFSTAKKTSLFTAFITSIEALPIGILALRDTSIFTVLKSTFHFDLNVTNIIIDIIMVFLLCMLLFLIQFWVTNIAAKLAFQINTNKRI